MESNENSKLLKVSLLMFIVVSLGYGVIYLLFPEVEIKAAGGEPIPPGWIRWFGGVFIALGIGAIMIFRNPIKQGIFITTISIGTLLVGLTLFYTVLFEFEGFYNIWNTIIPAIVNIILSVIFWISLNKSKAILWQ